jgi:undecaprenyl-diphosphatase
MVSRDRTSSASETMDPTLWMKALVMGVVEGATEFIPVSSTGHLILVGHWLAFEGDVATTFEIVIQLGAILAVLWLYRAKVFGALTHARVDPTAGRFLVNLGIAFVPAAAVGFLIHDYITDYLFSPKVVALTMLIGGVAILVIERWHRPVDTETVDQITPWRALGIGLAQMLSLIPGVSRSGATIMGALALGTSRVAATEFSFFLAIPVMFAATGYELLKSLDVLSVDQVPLFVIGFVTSFVSALVVVKAFLGFVSKHSFAPFAWYRIAFGLLLLAVYR